MLDRRRAVAIGRRARRPAGLQEKLAAAKQAAAQNQQALRSYTWIEKTELSLKGEVKNTKIESCRYGPDGKVQKTPLVDPPPPRRRSAACRAKVIEKKKGEMKEEMQAATALVHSYVPPTPEKIQAVMAAGKVTLARRGRPRSRSSSPTTRRPGTPWSSPSTRRLKAMRQIDVDT